jgi:hypothetical protein
MSEEEKNRIVKDYLKKLLRVCCMGEYPISKLYHIYF